MLNVNKNGMVDVGQTVQKQSKKQKKETKNTIKSSMNDRLKEVITTENTNMLRE